ncbi:MAG: HTH domain-containing protein [Flavobacteriaceae bacterium]|nr:HTH domain-containing protein [Flavobacteriaceae bacterium]
MAYSLDFRKHIFIIKEKENLTFQELSDRFSISIRTLFRWLKRIEPKNKRDKPSSKIDMKRWLKN